MGRKILLPVFKSALLRNATATSFKHALYWLMRNLLKIPRGAAGVNVEWILAGIGAWKPFRRAFPG